VRTWAGCSAWTIRTRGLTGSSSGCPDRPFDEGGRAGAVPLGERRGGRVEPAADRLAERAAGTPDRLGQRLQPVDAVLPVAYPFDRHVGHGRGS
jgi:hypothetical protein